MVESRFSREHGFLPAPPLLAYDQMPDLARKEIFYILRHLVTLADYFSPHLWHVLRPYLRRSEPNADVPFEVGAAHPFGSARRLLETEEWNIVLDLCQEFYRLLYSLFDADRAGQLNSEINKLNSLANARGSVRENNG